QLDRLGAFSWGVEVVCVTSGRAAAAPGVPWPWLILRSPAPTALDCAVRVPCSVQSLVRPASSLRSRPLEPHRRPLVRLPSLCGGTSAHPSPDSTGLRGHPPLLPPS